MQAASWSYCGSLEDKLLEINTTPQTHRIQIHRATERSGEGNLSAQQAERLWVWGPVLPSISLGASMPALSLTRLPNLPPAQT